MKGFVLMAKQLNQRRIIKTASPNRHVYKMPSLAKRRTWFADDDPQGQEPETVNDDTANDDLPDSADGTFSAEYVEKLRKEAATRRVRAKELEARLAELEAEQKKRQESELAQKEDFKTLAEQRAQELETLKAQLREREIQALRMQTVQELGLPAEAMEFLTGDNEETIKAQAEKFKSLLPEPSEAGSQPRQKRTALIPGGEPAGETREQKNIRLGLSPRRNTIQ